MALVQDSNSVRFIGMTSVDLNGNRIIGRQANGAEVSVPANNQSLTQLAEKINIRVASMTKVDPKDQEIVDRYKDIRKKGCSVKSTQFLEFYLSANRLNMSPLEMYSHLGYADSNLGKKQYILDKIQHIKWLAEYHGFVLPELNNNGDAESEISFLRGLNWNK